MYKSKSQKKVTVIYLYNYWGHQFWISDHFWRHWSRNHICSFFLTQDVHRFRSSSTYQFLKFTGKWAIHSWLHYLQTGVGLRCWGAYLVYKWGSIIARRRVCSSSVQTSFILPCPRRTLTRFLKRQFLFFLSIFPDVNISLWEVKRNPCWLLRESRNLSRGNLTQLS